jgi:uncharacterized protein YidB (DUF937 family)
MLRAVAACAGAGGAPHCLPRPGIKPAARQEGTAMGVFDSLIAGAVGAEMATVVNRLIERHGGVQGLVNQFEKQGFGSTVKSWVGTGPNQPISSDEIHKVLGADTVNDLAQKMGVSPQELAQKLSQMLPKAVDAATPGGVIPKV